jgi:hypothetical protein
MLKTGFGQAYCQDLARSILQKFILYFFEFYTISYEFLKFIQISWNLNQKNEFG